MVKMPESVETADVWHFFLKTFFYKNFLTHLKYSLNLIQNLLFFKNNGYTCKQSYDEL